MFPTDGSNVYVRLEQMEAKLRITAYDLGQDSQVRPDMHIDMNPLLLTESVMLVVLHIVHGEHCRPSSSLGRLE